MNLEQIVNKFEKYPKTLTNGAGFLSKRWNCDKELIYKAKEVIKNKKKYGTKDGSKPTVKVPEKFPKILLLDIETAPIRAAVWGLWKQNINLPQIYADWYMLTWSAKWLYSADIMSDALTPEEALIENDSRIVLNLWHLLDEADIVIAHNGNSFDIPKINTRFIKHGYPPTTPYQQIDTLLVARKQFGFSSNKLEALAIFFGLQGKNQTDFELWNQCLVGNQAALDIMEEYNREDVRLLEEVYLILRPWIKGHPNVALYMESDKNVCSNCGLEVSEVKDKYYYTTAGKYQVYECFCGAHTRGRHNLFDKTKKNNLTLSLGN